MSPYLAQFRSSQATGAPFLLKEKALLLNQLRAGCSISTGLRYGIQRSKAHFLRYDLSKGRISYP